MPESITTYQVADDADLARLTQDIRDAYANAALIEPAAAEDDDAPPAVDVAEIEIGGFPDLIGVDPAVYRQIQAALRAGKRHLMFYGPPGTGKTEIARHLAGTLYPKWRLITGSADWTSQDIIGGYQPIGGNEIGFVPGVLLKEFDRPLIIDELNRCDIDKVIGPLFTVLSGQASTLPYRVNVADPTSEQYVILPQAKPGAPAHEFAPGNAWRIIATINSIDKASLYQMSYALTRRFAWIYVDAPADLTGFLTDFLRSKGMLKSEPGADLAPLIGVWQAVNEVRTVGAAPVIDIIHTAAAIDPDLDFMLPATEEARIALLDGFYMYLLPMLDGIMRQDAAQIADSCIQSLGLPAGGAEAETLRERLEGLAI